MAYTRTEQVLSAAQTSFQTRSLTITAATLLAVVATTRSVHATELEYPPDFGDCTGLQSITASEEDYLCDTGGPGGVGAADETAPTSSEGGGGDDCTEDAWNNTEYPVDVRYGSKVETAIDMVVRLPGRDFQIVRRHASNLTDVADRPNYIGAGWTLSNFSKLQYVPVSNEPHIVYLVTGDNTRVRFEEADENTPSTLEPDWISPPGSRLILKYVNQPLNRLGTSTALAASHFVLIDPGNSVRYYRGSDGRLLREMDVAGNVIEHVATTGGTSFFRPDHLMFYTKDEALSAHPRPSAILNINYTTLGTAPDQFVSTLQLIRPLERASTSGQQAQLDEQYVVTQEVRYTYFETAPAGRSSDLGTSGDLVQVETFELTNAGLLAAESGQMSSPVNLNDTRMKYSDLGTLLVEGTDPTKNPAFQLSFQFEMAKESEYRRRVTQYRYYNTSGTGTTGTYGQIKMIHAPEQLEHFQMHTGDDPSELMKLGDATAAGLPSPLDQHSVADIATKQVFYYPEQDPFEHSVKEEIILASCGCGGSSAVGKKLKYSYLQDGVTGATAPPDHYEDDAVLEIVRSVIVDEFSRQGSQDTPHRRTRYDLIDVASELGSAGNDDPQYRTAYRAIWALDVNGDPTGNPWVWRRDYFGASETDGAPGQVKREYEPSSFVRHWIGADPTQEGYEEFVETGGLVTHYTYWDSSDFRYAQLKSMSVSEVSDGTFANESLVVEYDYEDDELRSDLLTKIVRHRNPAVTTPVITTVSIGGSSPTLEITEYETYYGTPGNWTAGVDSNGRYDRRDVIVEVEPTDENGRSDVSSYSTVYIYDDHDRVQVMASVDTPGAATDSSRTDFAYDPVHGELVSRVDRPIPTSGEVWDPGATAVSADLTRVTRYGYDVDGRLITLVAPTGRVMNRWRIMEFWEGDAAIPPASSPPAERFAVLTLPAAANSAGTSFAGPIVTQYFTAADKSLGAKQEVATSVTRVDEDGDGLAEDPDLGSSTAPYATGAELGKTWLIRNLSGLVTAMQRFEDVTSTVPYLTEYVYDEFGRLDLMRTPNQTTRRYSYDVLDRLIKEEISVYSGQDLADADTGASFVTTTQYFFDGADASPATQAIGNGNLRLVRQHVDSTVYRDAEFWYDFRDRVIASLSMVDSASDSNGAIRETLEYDNLDRVTAVERYDSGDGPVFGTHTARAWREETLYNQRGLPYRRRVAADPATATPAEFLVWNTWYDQHGRVIASEAPTSPATKLQYDGIGRVAARYVTDRDQDPDAGGTDNWLHAAHLVNDNVLEQTEVTYRSETGVSATDQIERRTHRMRAHADESAGALPSGDLASAGALAVATYSAIFYDEAARPVTLAEYGTNDVTDDLFRTGTNSPWHTSWPPSPLPSPDVGEDLPLVTAISYNDRGLVSEVMAPDETRTAIVYDDLNRRVGVIENYTEARTVARDTDSTPWKAAASGGSLTPWPAEDDRTTIFIYDGVDNLTHRIAVNYKAGASPEVQEQVTEYVYGVSTAAPSGFVASTIASNDLLAKAIYPDELGGSPELGMEYAYNRLGELIALQDQNGTRHEYTRDAQGRVTLDLVTAWGDSTTQGQERTIDKTIDRIAFTFDAIGRLTEAESKSNTTVKNAVGFTYAASYAEPWALTGYRQNPTGDLGQADERTVAYTYLKEVSANSGTHHRVNTIGYPSAPTNRTTLTMDYGSGVNDAISRAMGFDWGTGRGVDYSYLGLGSPVLKTYVENGVTLDRWVDPDDDDASDAARQNGVYNGLDRYGRIRRQVWYKPNAGGNWWGGKAYSDDAQPANDGTPAIVDLAYTYDNASDIRTRIDERWGSRRADRDERYDYDELNRLVEAQRGVDTGSSITAAGDRGQFWTLDHLGSQTEVITDTQGTTGTFESGTDLTLTRVYNLVNETTSTEIEIGGGGPTSQTVRFDASGNQLEDDAKDYAYDAWNRLMAVDVGGTPRARYTYYPLHQRATRLADIDLLEVEPEPIDPMDPNPDPDLGTPRLEEGRLFYYDAAWRLFEEHVRVAEEYEQDILAQMPLKEIAQRLWGLTYIDEYLGQMIDSEVNDSPPDGDMGTGIVDRHLAVTDRRHDVVAMIKATSGTPIERVRYTAYGIAQVRKVEDVTGTPGTVSGADTGLVLGAWGSMYRVHAGYDVDLDFNLDGVIDGTDYAQALAAQSAGAYDAAEGRVSTVGNTIAYAGYVYDEAVDMHHIRFRWYSASMGRWVTRDPAAYIDGNSLYEPVASRPYTFVDPLGLYRSSRSCQADSDDYNSCEWQQHRLDNARAAAKQRCGVDIGDYGPEIDALLEAAIEISKTGGGSALAGAGGALQQAAEQRLGRGRDLEQLYRNPWAGEARPSMGDLANARGNKPIWQVAEGAGKALAEASGVIDIIEAANYIENGEYLAGFGTAGLAIAKRGVGFSLLISVAEMGINYYDSRQLSVDAAERLDATCKQLLNKTIPDAFRSRDRACYPDIEFEYETLK